MNTLVAFEGQRLRQLTIAICIVALTFLSYGIFAVYASGLGGYISEKVISSSGTTNSALVIDRFGVSNSYLDVAMGPVVAVASPVDVTLDGAGSHATLRGSITSLNGSPTSNVWFEWGYSPAYGNTTPVQVATIAGTYTATINHFLATNQIYYRFVGQADGTNYSSGTSFLLTDGGALGTAVPTLPIIPLVFMAGIIAFMLIALRDTENQVMVLVILAVLILVGLAFISGMQQVINSLF